MKKLLAISLISLLAIKNIVPEEIDARIVSRRGSSCQLNEEAVLMTAKNFAAGLIQKQINEAYNFPFVSPYFKIAIIISEPVSPSNREDWQRNEWRDRNIDTEGLPVAWNHLAELFRGGMNRGYSPESIFLATCAVVNPPLEMDIYHPAENEPYKIRWVNVAPIRGGGYLYIPYWVY